MPFDGIGDTEISILWLAQAAAHHGYHNVIFHYETAPVVGEFFAREGFETASYGGVQPSIRHPAAYWAESRSLASKFRRLQISVVHGADWEGVFFTSLAGKLADMLELTLQSGFSVAIYTTLHGMTLTDAERCVLLLQQYESQLDHLCLHLPDANMNMRGWRESPEYAAVLERVLALRSPDPGGIGAKMSVMTMDGAGALHPSLKSYRGAVTQKDWSGHSRAGNLTPQTVAAIGAVGTPRHASAVRCGNTPFYDQNVLLPNGDVILCCMDYSLKHKLGNLLEQDYDDLFLSPELSAVHAENAKPRFCDRNLCKACAVVEPLKLGGADWSSPISFRDTLSNLLPSLKSNVRQQLQAWSGDVRKRKTAE